MPPGPGGANASPARWPVLLLSAGTAATFVTLYLRARWQTPGPLNGLLFLLLVFLGVWLAAEIVVGRLRVSRVSGLRLRVVSIALALLGAASARMTWSGWHEPVRWLAAAAVVILLGLAASVGAPGVVARLRVRAWPQRMRALLAGTATAFFTFCRRVRLALREALRGSRDRLPRASTARAGLLAGTLIVLLVALEISLRIRAPGLTTYMERIGRAYQSQFAPDPTWFHVMSPGIELSYQTPEFPYSRQVNSLGLMDEEFTVPKPPGEFRILAVGDSFTEGVGANAASSWVEAAERWFEAQVPGQRIAVLNAGVSGSDPVYGYALLDGRLRSLEPNLVVVVINRTDIPDVVVRGGMERFRPDGTVAYRPAPLWEGLYARSYLVRLVVHGGFRYNFLLMSDDALKREEQRAVGQLLSAVRSFRELCAKAGCGVSVVTHPTKGEAAFNHYDLAVDTLVQALQEEPGIDFLDLLAAYARDGTIIGPAAAAYYWPVDGHHNARGYGIMGVTIARHLRDRGLIGDGRDAPGAGRRPGVSGQTTAP